jgi:hypothetical protein
VGEAPDADARLAAALARAAARCPDKLVADWLRRLSQGDAASSADAVRTDRQGE